MVTELSHHKCTKFSLINELRSLSLISVMLFENAAEKSHDAARVLACKFIFESDRDDSITFYSTILDSWISNASMAFYSAAAAAAPFSIRCSSSASTASPTAIRTFRPARSTFRRRVLRAFNG